MLARRMWDIAENRYKAIVVDGDQLLWPSGYGAGQSAIADGPSRLMQSLLLKQRDAGMLLCLYSRYREEDVYPAFAGIPEMALQRDDFVASAFGCQEASRGLSDFADELGLELDSFIFLHSDPVVCAEVESRVPEALTLQVPTDAGDFPDWLKHTWALDRVGDKR
jgi:predicted enzyme involved in methoxymalonyl-ACP biosynthesis